MHKGLSHIPVLLMTLAILTCHGSELSREITDEQWKADLQQISASIKEIHFKPFHVLPEAEFDAAVQDLGERIPELSDTEIVVAMAQLIAKLRDGHTRIHMPRQYPAFALLSELGHSGTPPPKFRALELRSAPVRFGLFDDGLFITAARPEYQALIGNKVLELDDTTVDAALETTKLVSFFENDSRARLMAPDRLALPDVTRVLGITESSDVMFATTADSDGQLSVTELATLNEPGLAFVDGAPEKKPLWLSRTDEYRWYTVLDDTDAIYVQVNQFEENPAKPYGDFVAESMAAARAAGVSRFVIDLRHNSGGIGAWVTPFVIGLGRSEFNKYGQLFILVGRTTFSAAQTFMHKFEELTYAMFVGEPSGAKPSHFSDPRRIVLDNSGLTLRISTIYWHSWLANDFRDAIEPHISAPISAADYFNGTDPALQAALSYRAPRTLALQIDEQFRQGKNQNAILLFQRFMNDTTVQDHSQAIPDLLDTADRLVDDGFVRPGYFIYLLARMSYPEIAAISPGLARIEALMN